MSDMYPRAFIYIINRIKRQLIQAKAYLFLIFFKEYDFDGLKSLRQRRIRNLKNIKKFSIIGIK